MARLAEMYDHLQRQGTEAMKPKSDAATRKKFAELVRKARAGDLPWLDEAIRKAGYGDPPGDGIIVTSRQLERGLQLKRQEILKQIKEGMPRLENGSGNRGATFDLWACISWFRRIWQRPADQDEDEIRDWEREKRVLELRRRKAETEMKEREALVASRKLVDREKVSAEVGNLMQLIRAGLDEIPADLAESFGDADKAQTPATELIASCVEKRWAKILEQIRIFLKKDE